MTLFDLSCRVPLVQGQATSFESLKEKSSGVQAVALAPDQDIEELRPYLVQLQLVVLHFPIFRDGRAFTQARALREYENYTGEIRAEGHILPDQAAFLLRCGVDSVVLPNEVDITEWETQLKRFSFTYQ